MESLETAPPPAVLSYDEDVSYEDQVQQAKWVSTQKLHRENDNPHKRKRQFKPDDNAPVLDEKETRDENDPTLRPNTVLISGTAIGSLHTTRLFSYARHFGVEPLGVEWVDDQTAIYVFASRVNAQHAFETLKRPGFTSFVAEADGETYETAQSVPTEIWPVIKRLETTEDADMEGKSNEMAGDVFMRIARTTDVKRQRANDSEFYAKFGKDGRGGGFKRARGDNEPDRQEQLDALDKELNAYRSGAVDDEEIRDVLVKETTGDQYTSRMRSDLLLGGEGRSLEDRQSDMISNGLPVLVLPSKGGSHARGGRRGRRRENRDRKSPLPPRKKTAEELDAELEAYTLT